MARLVTAITTKHIDTLWSKMARIYGHKWLSNFGERDDGTWLQGLAGLLPDELAQGLRACLTRADEWPPTLPEFRRMCFGLPSPEDAVGEALSILTAVGDVPHYMRVSVGSWDRVHLTEKQLRRRYKEVYAQALRVAYSERLMLHHDKRKELCKL